MHAPGIHLNGFKKYISVTLINKINSQHLITTIPDYLKETQAHSHFRYDWYCQFHSLPNNFRSPSSSLIVRIYCYPLSLPGKLKLICSAHRRTGRICRVTICLRAVLLPILPCCSFFVESTAAAHKSCVDNCVDLKRSNKHYPHGVRWFHFNSYPSHPSRPTIPCVRSPLPAFHFIHRANYCCWRARHLGLATTVGEWNYIINEWWGNKRNVVGGGAPLIWMDGEHRAWKNDAKFKLFTSQSVVVGVQ